MPVADIGKSVSVLEDATIAYYLIDASSKYFHSSSVLNDLWVRNICFIGAPVRSCNGSSGNPASICL